MQITINLESESLIHAAEIIAAAIDRLAYAITIPPQPGRINLVVLSEGNDGMLNFKLVLPTPGAPDVIGRELTYAIGTAEPTTVALAAAATEYAGLSGNDNDAVAVSLVDVDDAGNRSEARSQTFTLTDTIAPPQPGELGLVIESET